MARGGPPLTQQLDIVPIRRHALAGRGQQRFGARAGSGRSVQSFPFRVKSTPETLRRGRPRFTASAPFDEMGGGTQTPQHSWRRQKNMSVDRFVDRIDRTQGDWAGGGGRYRRHSRVRGSACASAKGRAGRHRAATPREADSVAAAAAIVAGAAPAPPTPPPPP